MTTEELIEWFKNNPFYNKDNEPFNMVIKALSQELNIGHCKDCIYFHSYHEIERVPHITAHNVCYRWGNKCFTKEDGYCYLFEPNGDAISKQKEE